MNKAMSKDKVTIRRKKSAKQKPSLKPHRATSVDSAASPETSPKADLERAAPSGAVLSRAERLQKLVDVVRSSGKHSRPEEWIDSLKKQGIDVEVHQSRDGRGGQIVIIPPGARENPEFTKSLHEYFQMLDGDDAKERP